VEVNDPKAVHNMGCEYRDGTNGYPQDYKKALELYRRAAELGHTDAYASIGFLCENGRGVEVDKKKAIYYYELAAMGGSVHARHNIGLMEKKAGNYDRALKHYMIAVRSGDVGSLQQIKKLHSNGHATKEDYTKALQSYQVYLSEIKSPQRDKAAAAQENYRYH